MVEPPHPVLAVGPGAPCRRPGRRRDRREPRTGARRRRADRGRLRRRAGRRRSGRGAEARRAAGLADAGPRQSLLRLASRRPGRGRCRDRQGGAGRQARPDQQPARAERDGAARRDRRIRPRDRRIHALHDEPEPACDPAADGRLRAAHPGGAAARRRARCRRRFRIEDLPLRRGGDRHLGRRQGAASRSNGPPSARKASCPTRMAATTSRMSSWRSTRDAKFTRAEGLDDRQYGRLSLDLRDLHPDLSLRHPARRHLHDPGDLCRDQGGVHQHRAGRCLSRRRAARRRRSCWSASSISRPTNWGSTRPNCAAATSSRPTPSRIRRRSRCNTTAATTRRPCEMALEAADYAGFEARRQEAASRGKLPRHRHRHLYRGLRHRALGRGRLIGRPRRAVRVAPRCGCIRPAASRC